MKCFYHANSDAQATCRSCGKSLCRECFETQPSHLCKECEAAATMADATSRQLSAQEISKGYRARLREGFIFLAGVILAFVSPILWAVARGLLNSQSGWLHLVWIVPWFIALVLGAKYGRALHDWYYASQNLVWIKSTQSLNNTVAILGFVLVLVAPIVVPIILLVLWLRLRAHEKRVEGNLS